MSRTVVATLWRGPYIVARLAPGDPAPTQAELDEWATGLTATNDGVRPVVRVLEHSTYPASSPAGGPAGSTPGRRSAYA